jgi:hypothetical protein
MLEGTSLNEAYSQDNLQNNTNDMSSNSYSYINHINPSEEKINKPEYEFVEPPVKKQSKKSKITYDTFDTDEFNKKYEQQRKISETIQKNSYSQVPQLYNDTNKPINIIYTQQKQPSYFDKLISKKKELMKIVQISFIITLGISIYYFIDHYLTFYINSKDFSFERQFLIRLLFPISIIFIIWNLRIYGIK